MKKAFVFALSILKLPFMVLWFQLRFTFALGKFGLNAIHKSF